MRILKYFIFSLFASIFLHGSLWAASLNDIYREALENDTQYKIARYAYMATQEKLTQGRAGLLPNVDFSGRARNVDLDTERLDGDILIRNRGVTVTATQPIFRIENFIIYQQSKNEVAQGDTKFILAAQDLVLRVTQAYFDILIAQVNVDAVEMQEKAFAQQLVQVQQNLASGLNTIVDLNEAEARYDLVLSQEIAARNALEISKRNLQSIINRFPDNLPGASIEKIISNSFILPQGNMEEWVLAAEQKNIALKVQQFAHEIAKQEVQKNMSRHYPTVDLVGQYTNQIDNPFVVAGRGIDYESKMIGLELKIPIFHGLSTQSRVRESLANRDKAREELENGKRMIGLLVRQHYLNLTNGSAQVKALKKALLSSRSQLDSTILGQQSGIRIEIDVLNSQQQYYSARKDLAVAYYNYLMSWLRLKADVGELDEFTLEEINALL